jgi:PAS domain S-box-containing protein
MGFLPKLIYLGDVGGWLHVSSCLALCAASITFVWWAFSAGRRSIDLRLSIGFWFPVLLATVVGVVSLLASFESDFSTSSISVALNIAVAIIAWCAVVALIRSGRAAISETQAESNPRAHESLQVSENPSMPTLADYPGTSDSFVGKLETAIHDARYARTLLDATIESTASGVVICDRDTNFLVVNPTGTHLLGEICHLPQASWTSEVGIFLNAEDTEPAKESILPLFRATQGERVDGMELLVRNGVSKIPIWLRSNASPIVDHNGVNLGAVAVFEDITELRESREQLQLLQKETEFELDNTNQRLKRILVSIEEVIWRGELEESVFQFVYFSPGVKKMTGLSEDQLIPDLEVYLDLIHEEDLKTIGPIMQSLFSGELDFSEDEYRIRQVDGSTRWIRNRVNAVNEGDKRVFQGVMIDITGERDARLALQRAERLASIGTLAAGIAHEINNPLGAMMLTTERAKGMVERDQFTKKQLLETCNTITNQIERCSKIATGVLRFASDDRSPREFHSLLTTAEEARNLILFKAEKNDISIEIDPRGPVDDLKVSMDETGICQVIVNLLANAVEASSRSSKIRMVLESHEDRVVLAVHDNGVGLNESTKERAFDPFYTTRRESGGTGLGLSMCHTIVTKHGGEISIGDSFQGIGAVVQFWIPKKPIA